MFVACYQKYGTTTKSQNYQTNVEYINQINDNNGDPLMFVIQFKNEQGYIVVSATKNYHPILVEVDSGIYDYDIISIWNILLV